LGVILGCVKFDDHKVFYKMMLLVFKLLVSGFSN